MAINRCNNIIWAVTGLWLPGFYFNDHLEFPEVSDAGSGSATSDGPRAY